MLKENKKVLFVHDGPLYIDSKDHSYYGIHYDNKLIKRYAFLGDKVTFLMRFEKIVSSEKNNFSRLNYPGFSFIPIPNFKSIKTYFPNRHKAFKIVESAVKDHDLIVARLPSSAGTIAVNIANRMKKPVLVEVVACVFDALWNYDWRGKLLASYKFIYYRSLIRKAPYAIYVTQAFLQGRYPTNGKSIGCSDVEIPSLDFSKLEKRIEKIRQSQEPFVLGTIGAFNVNYKGQKDLIKAIGTLKRKGKIFKYRLVGQGDPSNIKKCAIKYNVEEEVEIIGPLKHDEIFDFLENIDIYIQPSKMEGLPRAFVEAMSRACPCLGSNAGGIPELIENENIFKKGSIKQMQNKLSGVNKKWMLDQAEINFKKAMLYQSDILEQKRQLFFTELTGQSGVYNNLPNSIFANDI